MQGRTGERPLSPSNHPPSQSVAVEFASRTDVGRVRSRNEDNLAVVPELNAFIVADGMGGHKGGDEASRQACLAIEDYLRARASVVRGYDGDPRPVRRREVVRLLQEAIRSASERIVLEAEVHPDRQGMATTVVVAVLAGGRAFVAHVGDSRAYLLRDGDADLLTEDHSLFFELVRQGRLSRSAMSSFPYRNVVTRALGIRGSATADIVDFDLWPRDRLLLCTDGLHSYLDEAMVARMAGAGDPGANGRAGRVREAVRRLVDHANESGGNDNITAILIDVLRVSGDEAVLRARGRVIASLPIFATLPLADRMRLASLCDPRILEDGEVLFREGDGADGLYAVLEGEIEVRRGGDRIAAFGPGHELGEMSLLERHQRLVTGVATRPSEVLFLSRATFDAVIRRSPILASRLLANLVRVLAHRLRDTNDELAILRAHCESEGLAPPALIPSDLLEEDRG